MVLTTISVYSGDRVEVVLPQCLVVIEFRGGTISVLVVIELRGGFISVSSGHRVERWSVQTCDIRTLALCAVNNY